MVKTKTAKKGEMRVKCEGDADISTLMFRACFILKDFTWSKGKKERWKMN